MTGAEAFFAGKRVWVAGHRGLVGSALVGRLGREPCEILTVERAALDLTRQADVEGWVRDKRPDVVFIAAGKVGGILANSRSPAEFLYQNLMINANIVGAAHSFGVETLVALGSSCIYPRDAPQPILESHLLTGPLEPTNEGYAVAKIAALKLAQIYARQYGLRFLALMPTNLYGPNDNFDPDTSHVLPALVRKFSEAVRMGQQRVTLWGSGAPLREFMHVDDLADACVFLTARDPGGSVINVASGQEISIRNLAALVAELSGFRGEIVFDTAMPDGAPRKRLDATRLDALGWRPRMSLREGVRQMLAIWHEKAAEVREGTAPTAIRRGLPDVAPET